MACLDLCQRTGQSLYNFHATRGTIPYHLPGCKVVSCHTITWSEGVSLSRDSRPAPLLYFLFAMCRRFAVIVHTMNNSARNIFGEFSGAGAPLSAALGAPFFSGVIEKKGKKKTKQNKKQAGTGDGRTAIKERKACLSPSEALRC